MDAAEAAAWQSAFNSINQAATTIASNDLNYTTRLWNEKIMGQQRQWALEDWNRQNQYNSPQAQMERLRSAGLNPNLVYGNGADAMSASPPRSTESKSWTPEAPQFPQSNGVQQYMGIVAQQNQQDLVKQQLDVLKQESLLKQAQTYATLMGGETTEFNLGVSKDTRDVSIQTKQALLDQIYNNISLTSARERYQLTQNEIAEATKQSTIEAAVERVLLLRNQNASSELERQRTSQMIRNLKQDEQLKQYLNDLNKKGLNQSDPFYIRILNQVVEKLARDTTNH